MNAITKNPMHDIMSPILAEGIHPADRLEEIINCLKAATNRAQYIGEYDLAFQLRKATLGISMAQDDIDYAPAPSSKPAQGWFTFGWGRRA